MDGSKGTRTGDITCRVMLIILADFVFRRGGGGGVRVVGGGGGRR